MTGLVNLVRSRIAAKWDTSRRLTKSGCFLSLRNAPRVRVIVDFDKPKGGLRGKNKKHCDYLFVAEAAGASLGWALPIELKSGNVDATNALSQLQAGARETEKIVPRGQDIRFRPVLAFGTLHRAQLNKMKDPRNQIRFRGVFEATRLIRCGSPLTNALTG